MPALSLSDITASIQNADKCILIDGLKDGIIEKFNGRPICYSGNYGAVFKLKLHNHTKALRVWTKDLTVLPELKYSAKIISDQVSKSKLTCFSKFEYIEKGLLVRGNIVPVVVMDWCSGTNLKEYLFNNLGNSNILQSLADRFLELIKSLHNLSISHGDLQHGNIIIDNKGKFKLIDYDSMFFPIKEFSNRIEQIKGLPDFQHPRRIDNKFCNYKVDYFSELIIYLSIIALKENPDIWDEFDISNRDYSLLFSAQDFIDLKSSVVYKRLSSFSSDVKSLLKILDLYLSKQDITLLEPFYTYDIIRSNQSNFCIKCGHKFLNPEDIYCTKCGLIRYNYAN